MGYDEESARGLIRVSLGRFNTREQVPRFVIRESVAATSRPHALATSARLPSVHEQEFERANC
jgi:cysteine sulfinate desulfinase/cysteine desulfurase-like protein